MERASVCDRALSVPLGEALTVWTVEKLTESLQERVHASGDGVTVTEVEPDTTVEMDSDRVGCKLSRMVMLHVGP